MSLICRPLPIPTVLAITLSWLITWANHEHISESPSHTHTHSCQPVGTFLIALCVYDSGWFTNSGCNKKVWEKIGYQCLEAKSIS